MRVLEVELSQPLPAIPVVDEQTGQIYRRAVSLVRLHTQTLGVTELELGDDGLTAQQYADQIWRSLGPAITAHLRQDGLPDAAGLDPAGLPGPETPNCVQEREKLLSSAPFVSIVVATRDRAGSLAASLDSLLALDYPNYELVVVDNAPSNNATADLIQQRYAADPKVRYVREDFPGLGSARNRGLLEVKGEIVAFTDDDVVADRHWLAELVKNFDTAGRIGGVTGLVFAAELETQAQVWFDQSSRWSGRLERRIYDLSENRPKSHLYPYTTGTFGAGANMAFRASVLREIGGFDPALGAGSLARSGEDLAAFFEVIAHGYGIVYEPSAIIHHWHRREYAALYKQMYSYGVGLTAYLTKVVIEKPWRIFDLAVKFPAGLVYALSSGSAKNQKKSSDYPKELVWVERKGLPYGPLAYLRSLLHSRRAPRVPKTAPSPEPPDFQPVRVLEIELSEPVPALPALDERTGERYRRATALVRLHTQTLGVAQLELGEDGLTAQQYADQVWRDLGPAIAEHLHQDGLPEITRLDAAGLPAPAAPACTQDRRELLADAPFASIIVTTHDRPATLAVALDSLLALDYPQYEIIVVINAPKDNAIADMLDQRYAHEPKIRYVFEYIQGGAHARNRGIREVKGAIVAFTDDDVVADRYWLAELVRGFKAAPHMGGVTGLAFAVELETPAQVWFDRSSGWSGRLDRRLFDLDRNQPKSPFYPYSCGMVGTGANMAFKTSVLFEIGGADPALGTGTPPRGGDDLALYFDVLTRGYGILYQPSAIVHHLHRREYAALYRQWYAYGTGLTAHVTRVLLDKPSRIFDLAARLPRGLVHAQRVHAPILERSSSDFPKELTSAARRGLLYGPFLYLRSRWQRRHVPKLPRVAPAPVSPGFEPVRVLEVELSQPLSAIPALDAGTGQRYRQAVSLVRLHTQTVGVVRLDLGEDGLTAQQYADQIWLSLGPAIAEHLRQDGLPQIARLEATGLPGPATTRCIQERQEVLTDAPFVSVIVATRDRPGTLAGALHSLLAVDYPNYEIIVVDNAPSTSATADLVRQTYSGEPKIRYLREDSPGVSSAHNCGIMEAKGSIIAFTDDDVLVDRHWLAELVRGFDAAPHVGGVTGLVFAAELETPAQLWFDQALGWSGRADRRLFDLSANRPKSPSFPYICGTVGTGANTAFKTSVLRDIGGTDPALGAGSPALGGWDLALYFDALSKGYGILYQPSAIVHHFHRREYAALRRQMYAYWAGFTAYLTKVVLDKPWRIFDLAVRSSAGLFRALKSRSTERRKRAPEYFQDLVRIERKGFFYGPFLYLQSLWQTRDAPRIPRTAPSAEPPDFQPVRVLEVELSEPLPAIPALDEPGGKRYPRATALVRLHTQTLGVAQLQIGADGVTAQQYADRIWRDLGPAIAEHLRQDGLPEVTGLDPNGLPAPAAPKCVQERQDLVADAPFVTVIVPTHDRPDTLAGTLDSLLAVDYPGYEVLVVDNAPRTSATADLIRQTYSDEPKIRYLREDRQGASLAMNRGLMEARGAIIAIADDDVVADRYWLAELVRGFHSAEHVGGVTALAFAAELDTPAQAWFDQSSGWSGRLDRRLFDLAQNRPNSPLFPYSCGMVGPGPSYAFKASVLREVGGWDPTLGPGTPPRGGDDLALYFDVLSKGYGILYQPSAIVHHFHRREYAALHRQWYGYGTGLTAHTTRAVAEKPWRIFDFAVRLVRGFVYTLRSHSPILEPSSPEFPRALTVAARKGLLYGPFLYLLSRWQRRHVPRISKTSPPPEPPDFQPVRVLELELSQPLPDVPALDEQTGRRYQQANALVRLHTHTLGVAHLDLDAGGLSAQQYADQVWRTLGPAIGEHLRRDELPEVDRLDPNGLPSPPAPKCTQERQELLTHAPFVSVIVATHDRPASLAGTLDSLLVMDYPSYEIIVVDNVPSTSAAADLVTQMCAREPRVRYLREDRPGPAAARNRGLMEASGTLIAFTDDDVLVDRHWLVALVEAFDKADNVGAVTGLACAAELDTPAQVWFEQTSGWSGRLDRRLFDIFENRPKSPFFPYSCGMVGTGANMAYRASVLREIGGFDPALGAGTPSLNGEDIALFFEVLIRGYRMIYEPSAIVHHFHRREYAALRKQMYSYGAGMTAILTKLFMDRPSRILDFAARLPPGVPYALRSGSPLVVAPSSSFPKELTWLERRGMLFGPFGYLQSRWQRVIIQVPQEHPGAPAEQPHRPALV